VFTKEDGPAFCGLALPELLTGRKLPHPRPSLNAMCNVLVARTATVSDQPVL